MVFYRWYLPWKGTALLAVTLFALTLLILLTTSPLIELELPQSSKAILMVVPDIWVWLSVLANGLLLVLFIWLWKRSKGAKPPIPRESTGPPQKVESTGDEKALATTRNLLAQKQKELTASTLHLIEKNGLLEQIREEVNAIRKKADEGTQDRLGRLTKKIDHSFNLDKDWSDFRLVFESVHDSFFQQLKQRFPNLTAGEVRLCALLKLDLNTRQIAAVLGISPQSVNMARYRLRKSLGITKEINLVAYLGEIG